MGVKNDKPVVQLNEKELAKFKKLCEKYGIKYETEAEYIKSAQDLCIFTYYTLKITKPEDIKELS